MPSVNILKRKLVIVGDGACGKTCLLIVFTKGYFPRAYVPTVFENYACEVILDDRRIELALWDTAGQEDYDRLRPLSYPEANIVLICFSVDVPASLINVQEKWVSEVQHFCQNVPYVLVACKYDLRDDPDTILKLRKKGLSPVTEEEGRAVAKKIGAVKYVECSSKTGYGVDRVFMKATKASMKGLRKRRRDSIRHAQCCIV